MQDRVPVPAALSASPRGRLYRSRPDRWPTRRPGPPPRTAGSGPRPGSARWSGHRGPPRSPPTTTLNWTPGQPGLRELGDQARASLLLDGERPLVAHEIGPEGLHERGSGAHLADAEEPLDVAAREKLPVELLELAVGVGDGDEPPGFRGPPSRSSAPRGPPGRLATATGSRERRRPGRRPAGRRAYDPTWAVGGRGRGRPRQPRRRRRGPSGRGVRNEVAGGPPDPPRRRGARWSGAAGGAAGQEYHGLCPVLDVGQRPGRPRPPRRTLPTPPRCGSRRPRRRAAARVRGRD